MSRTSSFSRRKKGTTAPKKASKTSRKPAATVIRPQDPAPSSVSDDAVLPSQPAPHATLKEAFDAYYQPAASGPNQIAAAQPEKSDSKPQNVAGNTPEPSSMPVLRTPDGKFAPGHRKIGGAGFGNPKRMTSTAFRRSLMEQLDPFISNLGEYIDSIDKPVEKVLAICHLMPYAVPRYSTMKLTSDTEQRDLTVEQHIASMADTYDPADTEIDATKIKEIKETEEPDPIDQP